MIKNMFRLLKRLLGIHQKNNLEKCLLVKYESSIKYYNESFALLNFDKKEDANRAQKMAEEVAEKDALGAGVLEAANTQSEILIRGILEEVVGNYEMRFVSSENELQRMKDLIETTKTTDSSKATADSATNKND